MINVLVLFYTYNISYKSEEVLWSLVSTNFGLVLSGGIFDDLVLPLFRLSATLLLAAVTKSAISYVVLDVLLFVSASPLFVRQLALNAISLLRCCSDSTFDHIVVRLLLLVVLQLLFRTRFNIHFLQSVGIGSRVVTLAHILHRVIRQLSKRFLFSFLFKPSLLFFCLSKSLFFCPLNFWFFCFCLKLSWASY